MASRLVLSTTWRSALKGLGLQESRAKAGLFSSILVRSCVGGRSERKGVWESKLHLLRSNIHGVGKDVSRTTSLRAEDARLLL
jgi:hypothetical protein